MIDHGIRVIRNRMLQTSMNVFIVTAIYKSNFLHFLLFHRSFYQPLSRNKIVYSPRIRSPSLFQLDCKQPFGQKGFGRGFNSRLTAWITLGLLLHRVSRGLRRYASDMRVIRPFWLNIESQLDEKTDWNRRWSCSFVQIADRFCSGEH